MVKLRLRDNESVNEAVRRFRKLVEHAGVKKEMRKREFYEKPSDIRRRDRRRSACRGFRGIEQPEIVAGEGGTRPGLRVKRGVANIVANDYARRCP